MIALSFILFFVSLIGFLLGRLTGRGRWVKIDKPKTHQDRAHLWVKLDGAERAFTAEQLQIAADRAAHLSGRSDYYPPNF